MRRLLAATFSFSGRSGRGFGYDGYYGRAMFSRTLHHLDPRRTFGRARIIPFVRPVQEFVGTESASAVLLIVAAAIALGWANSPWQHEYERLLNAEISIDLAIWAVEGSLHFWINEVAMVLFFFVIGLEIKREITIGELSDPRVMAAPIAGALGGMVLPLAIFLLITQGSEGRSGWAIPMATDVAFALGIATLFASRVPIGLRAMLLTFVIVDDIGTVFVVAVFYSGEIQALQVLLTSALVGSMLVLYRLGVRSMVVYAAIGLVAWGAILESGIHPTTLGAVLGFLTPWKPPVSLDGFVHVARRLLDRFSAGGQAPQSPLGHDQVVDALLGLSDLSSNAVPHVDRLEHQLHPWVAFLVVPAFALANAGVQFDPEGVSAAFGSSVTWGVVIGLVVGKPVGLVAATWIAVRLGAGRPSGVTWQGIWAIGLVAGIGFTVALFVADLAFADAELLKQSKIGILAAFAVAGPLSFLAFKLLPRHIRPVRVGLLEEADEEASRV